jgi:hypothetical protein
MGLPTEMIGVLSPTWPFCALWPFGTTHDYMDYPQENKGIQLNPILWLSGYDLENDHSP